MGVSTTIRQIGYVVADLDQAIADFCAQGTGPWFVLRGVSQDDSTYRGEPSSPLLDIAFSHSGDVQLELIQVHDDGPSMYRDFRDGGGAGLHHVAWWVDDYDTAAAELTAKGWPVLQAGDRYAYFDTGTSGIVELQGLDDGRRFVADEVASAAASWDGVSDPVRSFG